MDLARDLFGVDTVNARIESDQFEANEKTSRQTAALVKQAQQQEVTPPEFNDSDSDDAAPVPKNNKRKEMERTKRRVNAPRGTQAPPTGNSAVVSHPISSSVLSVSAKLLLHIEGRNFCRLSPFGHIFGTVKDEAQTFNPVARRRDATTASRNTMHTLNCNIRTRLTQN